MEKVIALEATNVSKVFNITEDSQNTVKHRLFNFFSPLKAKRIEAVKNVDLEVHKGECVGLIGRNGCGKSTLIRLLAGVYPVDSGHVRINGTTLLMHLGLGMSQQLTARENIFVSASILGLSIRDTDKIFDQIIDFAELREFVDTKIKFFSSGMVARLGFSIAVNTGADIMFLDEIFSVGDVKFQEKAVAVFESNWIKGKTVILVSHSMDVVRKYCTRAAFMKQGNVEYFGDPTRAIELYMADNQ